MVCGGFATLGMALYGFGVYQYAQYRSRTSDYNTTALKSVMKHPKLVALIGEPIVAGYVFSRIRGGFDQDHVDLVVPLNGKNANGLLKYQADRVDDEWVIRKMEFSFLGEAGGVVRLVKDEQKQTAS